MTTGFDGSYTATDARYDQVEYWQGCAEQHARDLIAIAELAMPDSYFASDSRVNAARDTLLEVHSSR